MIKWLVLGPVAVIVIVFSVANRHTVTFSLAPLPFEIDAPLYLLLLAALLIGVILGGTASALSAWARARRRAAQSRRRTGKSESGQTAAAITSKAEQA